MIGERVRGGAAARTDAAMVATSGLSHAAG